MMIYEKHKGAIDTHKTEEVIRAVFLSEYHVLYDLIVKKQLCRTQKENRQFAESLLVNAVFTALTDVMIKKR